MLPSIPANTVVNISPAVIGTGGKPLALNTVLLSSEAIYPIKQYSSSDDVAKDYGSGAVLHQFSEGYFAGVDGATIAPDTLFITKYVTADKEARLIGASLRSSSLDELKAINGDLEIVIDGVSKKGQIDLVNVTSFSDAAQKIATALSIDCQFDAQLQAFILSSKNQGQSSSLSFATGSTAVDLGLTELVGAVIDNTTVKDTVQTAIQRVQQYTLNFATIIYANEASITLEMRKELSLWNSKQNSRYWVVQYLEEPTALIANNEHCFGGWLAENEIDGTTIIYGGIDQAVVACAFAASINFNEENGRATLDFKKQSGVKATVTDQNDAKALESNGYAYYGAWATANDRFVFMRNSVVSGKFQWVDAYLNQVYFNSQLQLAYMVMLTSYKSIPYNAEGKAIHRATAKDPIDQMLNFGGIQSGVDLSEQQKNLINRQAGFDAATQLSNSGYALAIWNATPQMRGKRMSLPMKLWYTDGGSIHSVDLASINVQ